MDLKGLKRENYPFLSEEIPIIGFVGGLQSHNLFFFLPFLYCRKQGNSLATENASKLLKTNSEDESDKLTNANYVLRTISSFELVAKAFILSNDISGYFIYIFTSFHKLLKKFG